LARSSAEEQRRSKNLFYRIIIPEQNIIVSNISERRTEQISNLQKRQENTLFESNEQNGQLERKKQWFLLGHI